MPTSAGASYGLAALLATRPELGCASRKVWTSGMAPSPGIGHPGGGAPPDWAFFGPRRVAP